MPLPLLGNPKIDALINQFNSSTDRFKKLRVLGTIEGLVISNIAARPALNRMAAIKREREELKSTGIPFQPSPTVVNLNVNNNNNVNNYNVNNNNNVNNYNVNNNNNTSTSNVTGNQIQFVRRGKNQVKQEENWGRMVSAAQAKYAFFASKFRKGQDLIYGLAGPRTEYVLAVVPDYDQLSDLDRARLRIQPRQDSFDFVIIDTYNNAFLGTEVVAHYNTSLKDKLRHEDIEQSQNYLGVLEDEHPNVKSFRDYLEKVTRYNLETVSRPQDMMVRLGRASKAGIAYTMMIKDGRVHFILDGIDFGKIIDELQKPKDQRAITGKELRWLFRHWDEPKIKDQVWFWEHGVRTEPPWDQPKWRDVWAEYGEVVRQRHPNGYEHLKAFGT